MVRTKADSSSVKASVKAPRKVAVTPSTSSSSSASDAKKDYSGGNPYCPRETPPWQKSITQFFKSAPNDGGNKSEDTAKMDMDQQEVPGTS